MTSVYQLTDAATITPDFTVASPDNGQQRMVFAVTLGGNRTIANPVGALDGQHMVLRVTQDATGGRTLTWGSAFNFASPFSRAAPVLRTDPGVTQELVFGYSARAGEWWLVAAPGLLPSAAATQWPVSS